MSITTNARTAGGLVTLLALLTLTTGCSGLGLTGSRSDEPLLFDYRKVASFAGDEAVIHATGYYAIARRYMHPARAEWEHVAGATHYKLYLTQHGKLLGVIVTTGSPCYVTEGWDDLEAGESAQITIMGFDDTGRRVGLSRMTPFYVARNYDPARNATARRSYREAALMGFEFLEGFRLPDSLQDQIGENARDLPQILLSAAYSGVNQPLGPIAYPALHNRAHIEMVEELLNIAPASMHPRLVAYARGAAEHMMRARVPKVGYKWGGMIYASVNFNLEPTLGVSGQHDDDTAKKLARIIDPGRNALAGEGLIVATEVTGDPKYLEAAIEIAGMLVESQREDGSWPGRVDAKTGEIITQYSSSAGQVAVFLHHLNQVRPDPRYIEARDRAEQWMMEFPMRTFAWITNYEDYVGEGTLEDPFQSNLSNWDMFYFLRHLVERTDDPEALMPVLMEQLNWNDNHFMFYGPDALLAYEPAYPCCAEQGNPHFYTDFTPWYPMDGHTANWGKTMLAIAGIDDDPAWMEKARAAADFLTVYQADDGRSLTLTLDENIGTAPYAWSDIGVYSLWPASTSFAIDYWAELAAREDQAGEHAAEAGR